MSNRVVPRVIDYSVLAIGIALLVFCWVRFYTKNVLLSAVIGVLAGLLCSVLLYFINSKREKKKNLTKANKKIATFFATQISFCTTNQVLNFFCENLKTNYPEIKKQEAYLFLDKETALVPYYYTETLNIEQVKACVSVLQNKCKNIWITCIQSSPQAKELVSSIRNYSIQIFDVMDTFTKLFKTFDIKIPQIIDQEIPKLKLKEIALATLSRKKTKTYLILGLVLLLYSFIVPYKIYYLSFGSILILMAILTRVFPYEKKIKTK